MALVPWASFNLTQLQAVKFYKPLKYGLRKRLALIFLYSLTQPSSVYSSLNCEQVSKHLQVMLNVINIF